MQPKIPNLGEELVMKMDSRLIESMFQGILKLHFFYDIDTSLDSFKDEFLNNIYQLNKIILHYSSNLIYFFESEKILRTLKRIHFKGLEYCVTTDHEMESFLNSFNLFPLCVKGIDDLKIQQKICILEMLNLNYFIIINHYLSNINLFNLEWVPDFTIYLCQTLEITGIESKKCPKSMLLCCEIIHLLSNFLKLCSSKHFYQFMDQNKKLFGSLFEVFSRSSKVIDLIIEIIHIISKRHEKIDELKVFFEEESIILDYLEEYAKEDTTNLFFTEDFEFDQDVIHFVQNIYHFIGLKLDNTNS